MIKNLYGSKRKDLYSEGHKTKYISIKIKKDNAEKNNMENALYLEESNSNKLIEEKNNNNIDGYIYYGDNKIFKTKNTSYSSKNISNKLKTQNLFFKNNNINKHSTKNLYINKDNILNNNHNSIPRFQKEITRNKILNNFGNNKDILYQKIKHNFNRDNSNIFPFITKSTLKNYNDDNTNTNMENNLNIHMKNLNQLHTNFINSFKNKKGILNDIDFDVGCEKKNLNKKLFRKNHSQEWIIDFKIFSKINQKKNKIKTKEIVNKNRNNQKLKKSFSIENDIGNNDIKKIFDKKKIIMTNKILKENILSKNRSLDVEKRPNPQEIKIKNKIKIINSKKTQSEQQKKISPIKDNYIFSNPIKNKNFSFRSTKNMKITEDNNTETTTIKNSFKTSTYFFSPKFKKKFENNTLNIKEIINSAIANNIKLGQATMTSNFFNIGKNYLNNKTRKTQQNFFSYDYNKKQEQTKEEINKENNKDLKFNYLNLILFDFKSWEMHENIWENINKKVEENYQIYILPPNNEDILISNYIKTFSKKKEINFIKENIVNININDDNIKNPRNEIKKWKKVYKNSILRWHPDKLFPLLTELNLIDENIIKDLQRRSTIIINNINNMYQNIMETLNKILLNKK